MKVQIKTLEQFPARKVLCALTDHLGSVRDVVDNTGTVRNHIVYVAFGNITSQTNESVVFCYSYTGREFDKESNQYYYRARYYDANVGRFISEDPIGFAAGDINLYRYVLNNPVKYNDPRGKFKIEFRYRGASIPGIPIPSGFNHTDIIVTQDDGKMLSFWARKGDLGIYKGFIVADKELKNYKPGFIFFEGDPKNIQLIYENKPLKNKCLEIERTQRNNLLVSQIEHGFERIQEARVPYKALTTNSNSAAFQVIREIGIVQTLTPKSGVNPVGWEYNPFVVATNLDRGA